MSYIEFSVVIYTTMWLYYFLKNEGIKKRRISAVIFLIYYIFYIFPLVLNLVKGAPQFNKLMIRIAYSDIVVSNIFYFILILNPILFYFFSKPNKNFKIKARKKSKELNKIEILLHFILFIPIVYLIIKNKIQYFFPYGNYIKNRLIWNNIELNNDFKVYTNLMLLSLGIIFYQYLSSKKINIYNKCIYLLYIFMYIWIYGKRSIVALVLLASIFICYQKKMKTKKIICILIMSTIFYFGYSQSYQNVIRTQKSYSRTYKYFRFREDYGRDDVFKLSIYSEINDKKILNYRGQTILSNLLFFIPRKIWHKKSQPYAVYLTSYALNKRKMEYLGYALTTDIYSEMISNLGIVMGIILSNLILGTIAKFSYYFQKNKIYLIVSLYLGVYLILKQVTAYMPILYIWIFMSIFNWWKRKEYIGVRENEKK